MTDKGYKNYLLTSLMLVLAFNYVDRAALSMMLQDIKVDLDLSDTQLGFLTGFAFALFYSVMGIPIARWADRGNRVSIIAITTALWSVAVAFCGLAANFAQLLLVRVGVAVGEAGCLPPAQSLIADEFTRVERPRAMARYLLGGPLSSVIGYFVAGWLNDLYGWRITFILLGIPGIFLALICWLTLREPRRAAEPRPALSRSEPRISEVAAALWGIRTFRHLLMCIAVMWFFGAGIAQWQPTFFIRSYGFQTGELGAWMAVIWTVAGMLGMFLGGELATRRAPLSEALHLKRMAAFLTVFVFINSAIYLVHDYRIAFGLLALSAVTINLIQAPLFATIQTLVPPNMRAMAVAIIFLFANLIGMGLGPLAAGALSDLFAPYSAQESLRYALVCLSPGYFWAAFHLWRASRTALADLARGELAQAAENDEVPSGVQVRAVARGGTA